jgi:hypothetical protein
LPALVKLATAPEAPPAVHTQYSSRKWCFLCRFSLHQHFPNSKIFICMPSVFVSQRGIFAGNIRAALPHAATSSVPSPSRRVDCSAPHIWLRCPGIAHYALLDGPKIRISERKANLSLKREHRARCWQIGRTWSANEGHGGANDGAVGPTPHAPINTDGAALATAIVSCLPSPFKSVSIILSRPKIPIELFTPQQICPPTQ